MKKMLSYKTVEAVERERERERATLYSTWNLFTQATILSKNNLKTNKKLYSNQRISSIKNAKNKIIKMKDRLLKIACPFRAVKNSLLYHKILVKLFNKINKLYIEKWVIDTS